MAGYSRVRSYAALLHRITKIPRRLNSSSTSAALGQSPAPSGTITPPLAAALSLPLPAPSAPMTPSLAAALNFPPPDPSKNSSVTITPSLAAALEPLLLFRPSRHPRDHTLFPWDLLTHIYIRDGFWREALLTAHYKYDYLKIDEDWVDFDDFKMVKIIHHKLLEAANATNRSGFELLDLNMFVNNLLIAMYANSYAVDTAREVFDAMPQIDEVSCNTMILGLASQGKWGEVSEVLNLIPPQLSNTTTTWNIVIAGYQQIGGSQLLELMLRLISHMRACGPTPDPVTFLLGLNVCNTIRSVRPGMEIHGLSIRMHCDDIHHMRNALIKMYLRCGKTHCAHAAYMLYRNNTFDSYGPYPDTWNATIKTFADENRVEEAYWVLQDLIAFSMRFKRAPPPSTVMMIASLCGRVADIRRARELHGYVTKKEYEYVGCYPLWNSLVGMYVQIGMVSTAQKLFLFIINYVPRRIMDQIFITNYVPRRIIDHTN